MEAVDRNYKKILFLMGGIIIVCLIAILAFTLIPLIKSAKKPTILTLNIAPSTATVKINGEKYRVGSYDNLSAGSYTAEISQDGFSSKTISFELKNGETTVVYDYILSEAEGFSYFEKNKMDINTLRNINDSDVRKFLEGYDKKLKITANLPILLNYYDEDNAKLVEGTISDGSDSPKCAMAFCLKVDTSKDLEWRAKEVVELAGYNYGDYEVIYEN